MGFITVLAGHLFWGRIMQGRWNELLGEGRVSRVISAVPLIVIFTYGAIGFCIGVFNSNPWYYSLAFAIGGLVVNQGLIPLVDYFDKR